MGALRIRVLGPVSVTRDGASVPLPRSRKVRALLAFLALERAPTSRSRLCDLLWDVPNDPRGELRWCLSKLRSVLDDDDRRRVITSGNALIGLDLEGCDVDALEVEKLARDGVGKATTEHLVEAARFAGELLEDTPVEGPALTGWLLGQRQRYRAMHVAIVAELATRAPDDFRWLEKWIELSPFDVRPHERMISALARCGRLADAETHVNSAIRALEHEGLDWAPLRDAWQAARRKTPRISIVPAPPAVDARRHGSVVVMPFVEATESASQVANGLTDDIITRLAKLRVLFVIARGTSYALRDRGLGTQEAGRVLGVEYVVSGSVRRHGPRMKIVVELAETRDGGIVWSDELEGEVDETFSVLDSIVDRIVAAVAEEIERAESLRAISRPPSSLDAWEAYHRGLWHMYRFTGPDNHLAERLFRDALKLDPTFSRAHAGLSFTHFQNVFLDLTPDRDDQLRLALDAATESVAADDRDPAAHWALGRALWLRGVDHEAIAELERSVELSPNFALGHYTLGFVHAQSGDPTVAIAASDHSRKLSPFDPLQFGMLGSRAIAHMRLGQREEAAEWAVRAASRPNAHGHILAIAATNLALVNRDDEARAFIARVRARLPGYSVDDFLRAFRFEPDGEKLVRHAARRIGF